MSATIRKWSLRIGLGILGLVLLFGHFKERNSYSCQVCWSRKHEYQWRLGSWMSTSVPLTPVWQEIFETRFRHDFLPADHFHQWRFAQGSPYHFFGTTWGGCALGDGRHESELCRRYESDSNFRKFIEGKLQDGSLTRSNLLSIVSAPASRQDLRQQERDLLDVYYDK